MINNSAQYFLGTRTVVIEGSPLTNGAAVFSNPTRVSERETFPLPVPGQLECCIAGVYDHPPVVYRVEKICVMHEPEFTHDARKRKGTKIAIGADGIPYAYGGGNAANKHTQINSTTFLINAKYIVRFSMYYKTGVYRVETPEDIRDRVKHIAQFDRHLKKQDYYRDPYLGIKGCPCEIRLATDADLAETPADVNMTYRSPLRGTKSKCGTYKDFEFYDVNCVHGIINVPEHGV